MGVEKESAMFRPQDRVKCQRLFDRYYAGRKFHDSLYRDMIRKYLHPGDRLLDAGCGRYLTFCKELSDMAGVVGIDLEETLETDNRSAPLGVRGDVSKLPFRDGCFDMVISRSVVEHLADPPEAFREFARVLRPGGRVVILTPNKYDYVSIIAAVTPYWLHRYLVSRIFPVSENDVFPTLYRANTLSAIGRAFHAAGLRDVELDTINHYPAYLMFSPVLFRLGVLYERFTSLAAMRQLRGLILAVFEKPGTGAAAQGEFGKVAAAGAAPVEVS
jgi:ubiquinone/menaquinone biosynthesis C-methylase UbiE